MREAIRCNHLMREAVRDAISHAIRRHQPCIRRHHRRRGRESGRRFVDEGENGEGNEAQPSAQNKRRAVGEGLSSVMRMAIRRQSEAIRSHQRQSEAIRGNQRQSEAIRSNHREASSQN